MKCPRCGFDNPENTKFCGNCATPLPCSEETKDARTETLSVPLEDLNTGSVLAGRYEVIEELGKGGMGKVYKAFDREIDEKIAVKVIRPEIASNKTIIQRFQNELKMARKVTHKNVCRMHDLGKDGDTRFITMEYISGEDLKKSIRRMGPLNIRTTISLGKQICQGLSEAHRLGVYHRDLKPHNIMIDREGNVKIMDFGIALSGETDGITDSNIIVGTPQYLSPEQVEGKKVDHRSDIYSLGVILFETVTGQVPFDGETTLSIAVKHKSEIPRNPKDFNAQIPDELSHLILKCMEKDPEKRYQTADELCSELTQIESELPTSETVIPKDRTKPKPLGMNLNIFRSAKIIMLVIFISIIGCFFYIQFFLNDDIESPEVKVLRSVNSIIVLPLRDLSPREAQEPLNILITDMLIMNLHAFKELRVLPLTTSLAYQDPKKDIQTIGKEINVSYVLEGSLWRKNGMLQVRIQISSVVGGSLIWAKSFERPLEEYGVLQKEITKDAASALGIKDVDIKYNILAAGMSSEPITDEYFIRGRHFEILYYSSSDKNDFENSVRNYRRVVDENPADAKTYWRLGSICEARYNIEKDETYLDLMLEYFQKSYEIDPNYAEANMGMGWFHFYKKDNDQAYRFMSRAYELDPTNAEINFLMGAFFRSIGLYEQALCFYIRALELDPMPLEFELWHDVLVDCYSKLGKFEEAAEHSRQTLEIYPCYSFYMKYAWQLITLGKYQEAEVQLAEAEKLEQNNAGIRLYRGLISAARGQRESALKQIHGDDLTYRYTITSIYSLLGMKDDAIRNIRLGIDVGFEEWEIYFYSYPFLINNPFYGNLKDEPRFQDLLQREKTKYEDKVKRFKIL